MPGSLLSRSRVARHESTRSDRSDASAYSNASQNSAKKVSFNKAVRIKKYPKPKKKPHSNGDISGAVGDLSTVDGDSSPPSPEKRFWFKVYKNKHRKSPDPDEFRTNVIYYGSKDNSFDNVSYHPNPSSVIYATAPTSTAECGTQTPKKDQNNLSSGSFRNEPTPLHPSQMLSDPPHVKRNHVKKIVEKFNEEAVLQRTETSPPSSPRISPRIHVINTTQEIPPPPPEPPLIERNVETFSRFRRNPIVNGVKVMFGMGTLRKKDKTDPSRDKIYGNSHHDFNGGTMRKELYGKDLVDSEDSETAVKNPYPSKSNLNERENRSRIWSNNRQLTKKGDTDYVQPIEREDNGSYYFGDHDDDNGRRRGKVHVETWDGGNELVFDTTDVNEFSEKTSEGEFLKTTGEKHQLWRNNRRIIVYEDPPSPPPVRPNRRKAKSHNDLTDPGNDFKTEEKEKRNSIEHLDQIKPNSNRKSKDSWMKQWKTTGTKDKGVQCSKIPKSDKQATGSGFFSTKYKVIRPRNGVVSAYSNVPSLDGANEMETKTTKTQTNGYLSSPTMEHRNGSAIYSQVDKSKKKKNGFKERTIDKISGGLFKSRSEPLYIGPPPHHSKNRLSEDVDGSIYFDDEGDRKVKSSTRSFGFRLNTKKEVPRYDEREENWYDVDDDVKAVERQKRRGPSHHDIAEVRQEIAEEEEEILSDDMSDAGPTNEETPGSVMREVDYKKREISYENVHRPDSTASFRESAEVGSGLWYRDADEDYRREMAQSEVSYPAGNHVGSERFYTMGRPEKPSQRNTSPRGYTLDRRHLKDKQKVPSPSGVKILVNGREVNEKGTMKKSKNHRKVKSHHEDPSSVQSDPLYVRGGLAAAYQARQRAAVRRSHSTVAGNGYQSSSKLSPGVRRKCHGSSEASGASSESDSTRQRRPLVMYIPGVSHTEKSADENDKSPVAHVSRSQSMMTPTRPPKITPRNGVAGRSSRGNRHHRHHSRDVFEEEDDVIMPLATEPRRKTRPAETRKHSDIRRRHSMPKDTKFSWLKWRIKGKPSRQP